jgi:hypothetical protein
MRRVRVILLAMFAWLAAGAMGISYAEQIPFWDSLGGILETPFLN